MPKIKCEMYGSIDVRIEYGANQILKKYIPRPTKNGKKINFINKKNHIPSRNKVLMIIDGRFWDNWLGRYATEKNSRLVLAYLRWNASGRHQLSGWHKGGKHCKVRIIEFRIKGLEKTNYPYFFECKLLVNESYEKIPHLIPFIIPEDSKKREKVIAKLRWHFLIPVRGIAKIMKLYSEITGSEKTLIGEKRIYQIVTKHKDDFEVSVSDIAMKSDKLKKLDNYSLRL
jgi:hypothetical protein